MTEDKSDDHGDKLSIQKITFDKLSTKRMGEIYSMSKKNDFNDLIYYFKSKDITSTINSVGFKDPLHADNNIRNADVSIKK